MSAPSSHELSKFYSSRIISLCHSHIHSPGGCDKSVNNWNAAITATIKTKTPVKAIAISTIKQKKKKKKKIATTTTTTSLFKEDTCFPAGKELYEHYNIVSTKSSMFHSI